MTKELVRRQPFAVREETYWRELCLSLSYQERLYREALGCVDMEILEHRGDYETGMSRRLRFHKPIDAPAAITKIFGATVTIDEVSTFDAKKREWVYRMVPAMLSDYIDIRGVVTIEPGPSGVTQLSTNTVTCRIFGLGTIIEHFVGKSTIEGHEDKSRFTQRYIDEQKLA